MINEYDIDFMKDAQDEIYELRQRPITFIYLDKQFDPITNLPIGESEQSREVLAVITEIRSTRSMEGGIEYEQGDIKIDVKIELIEDIADKITRAEFDGKTYELLGGDRKGIGKRNRYEYLVREVK